MTLFLRALEAPAEAKAASLIESIANLRKSEPSAPALPNVYECCPTRFSAIAGSPFAYWLSHTVLDVFRRVDCFESEERMARVGLQTSDDARFVRTWTEIDGKSVGEKWYSFAKGGRHSPFYSDLALVVSWAGEGSEMKAFAETTPGTTHWSRNLRNTELYGRPGITWPLRAARFSPQALSAGSVFSVRGYSAFTPENELAATLAVFNSAVFDYLFKTALGRFGYPEFIVGVLQTLPWVPPSGDGGQLARLGRRAWGLRRLLDTSCETSHAFILPPELNERVANLDPTAVDREIAETQAEIDDRTARLYGLENENYAITDVTSAETVEGESSTVASADGEENGGEDEVPNTGSGEALRTWLVGVAFGRFDPRLATGERPIPPEPEPFDPLPSRSPAMYAEGDEPVDQPGLLVDDEGHPKDLTALVQRRAEQVSVEVPADVRSWLAREFFPLHIKMYSKSRRKAPIYWQLATPSASYSVWLYIHAFSNDTLFRVQNDYVAPKLAHEERQLEMLRAEAGPDPETAQRKAIEAQEAFVEELRSFLDEAKRIAPLWNPHLDDGVIINFAPLWRLVPQLKPWQKELKATWDALCAGKYDWAHLAMHLWPERVVPKCVQDRSLAIAHDLEDVFWYQHDQEKWKPREEPTRTIDALVKERTSSAVKSALKSLMEAPEQTRGARRGRGRR